jgi:hypothetical protein
MLHLGLSRSFVTLVVLSSSVTLLAAQEPAVPATPVAPRRPVMDAGTTLVPPRSVDRIQAELDLAKRNARLADGDEAAALERKSRAEAQTEVKKHEISTIEAKMKLADKEKNEAQKASLTSEKTVAERDKERLERLADLVSAEVEVADKRAAFARAGQKALEAELELARQRDARSRLTTPGPEATKLDQTILDLASKVLEAQRDRADAEADLVGKEKQLAERRIAVFRAETARLKK